jgi:hypothetical protein
MLLLWRFAATTSLVLLKAALLGQDNRAGSVCGGEQHHLDRDPARRKRDVFVFLPKDGAARDFSSGVEGVCSGEQTTMRQFSW